MDISKTDCFTCWNLSITDSGEPVCVDARLGLMDPVSLNIHPGHQRLCLGPLPKPGLNEESMSKKINKADDTIAGMGMSVSGPLTPDKLAFAKDAATWWLRGIDGTSPPSEEMATKAGKAWRAFVIATMDD